MRVINLFSSAAPYPLKLISYVFFGSQSPPPSPAKFHQHTRAGLVKKEPLLNTFLGIQAKTPL